MLKTQSCEILYHMLCRTLFTPVFFMLGNIQFKLGLGIVCRYDWVSISGLRATTSGSASLIRETA